MKKSILSAAICLVTLASSVLSQTVVPPMINYQGQLMDATGSPLATADYKLTFSIWDAAEGGTRKWGPQAFDGQFGNGFGPKVPVVQGFFNVMLGPSDTNNVSLLDGFMGGAECYLEVQVEDNPPISPRQQILSAPFALQAETAKRAETAVTADTALNAANATTAETAVNAQDAATLNGKGWDLLYSTATPSSGSRIKTSVLPGDVVLESEKYFLRASDGSPANAVFVDSTGEVGVGTTNPRARLDVNGAFAINGVSPIQFKKFTGKTQGSFSTGYSTSTYTVAVVGFRAYSGDIQENDTRPTIIHVAPRRVSSTWHIDVEFATHNNHEAWDVWVMAVDTRMCNRSSTF